MNNIANINEVNELIEKLFKSILGPIEKHRTMIQDAKQFIKQFPAPCDLKNSERTIVQKITDYLRFKNPSSHVLFAPVVSSNFLLSNSTSTNYYAEFANNYESLKKSNMKQEHRCALMTFLLSLADQSINNNVYSRSLTNRPTELDLNIKVSKVFQLAKRDFSPKINMPITRLFDHSVNCKRKYKKTRPLSESDSISSSISNISFESNCDAYVLSSLKVTRSIREMDQNYVKSHNPLLSEDVSRCAIYSFTGVEGLYLEKQQKAVIGFNGFELTFDAHNLNCIQAGMLLRLAQLGNYHDELKPYTEVDNISSAKGLMGQALVIALEKKLTVYYGMVAELQETMRDAELGTTLMDILSWSIDVQNYLHWLVTIAKKCERQKGSEIATILYRFLNNGNCLAKCSAKDLLIAVCGSFYQMLKRWLFDGELFDPHDEFFIACNHEANEIEFWDKKYYIRTEMLPSFVTMEVADKILVAGKSINFLRKLYANEPFFFDCEEFEKCMQEKPEFVFMTEYDMQWHKIINRIYSDASNQLLKKISGQYKLGLHLQAMRQYLLLGMGDFVNTLMERLKFKLDQPSYQLNYYHIIDILDTAVKSSTAQFEDVEILNNLDIQLLVSENNEIGWNVLSLRYKVKGPLNTLLESSSEEYQSLFKPLWRLKHMEFVISSCIWRDQLSNAKQLLPMAREINFLQYQLYLHTAELMHFIHQLAYYILFEVIECSWVTLQTHLKNAKTLDDVLKPHKHFLKTVKEGVLLQPESLSEQLERVYGAIERLEKWQELFYNCCFRELKSRQKYQKLLLEYQENDIGDCASVSESSDIDHFIDYKKKSRKASLDFELMLYSLKNSLENIANVYGNAVRQFVDTLNTQNDQSLLLLAVRLNFNEFYERTKK